jgi:DNA-binding transcriptional LysR family regulator
MRDLNALATFVAVVKLGSFTLAAEQLGISRALATKQIQTLEGELGVKLLNRSTRKLAPSQAGEQFYERCARLVADAEAAARDLEGSAQGPQGLIRVSTAISFGRVHLLPAIAAYLQSHPEVQIEVTLSEHFADLISGKADVVVRMADMPRLNNLVARRLAPARSTLVASPAYLARVPPVLAPADLARCNCLVYTGLPRSDSRNEWRFQGPLGDVAVKVAGNFRANNADGIAGAALAGVGIGMLPSFAVSEHLAAGRLVRVLPAYKMAERTLYAVFLPDRHLPERIRSFVGFLAERFGAEPYWDEPA